MSIAIYIEKLPWGWWDWASTWTKWVSLTDNVPSRSIIWVKYVSISKYYILILVLIVRTHSNSPSFSVSLNLRAVCLSSLDYSGCALLDHRMPGILSLSWLSWPHADVGSGSVPPGASRWIIAHQCLFFYSRYKSVFLSLNICVHLILCWFALYGLSSARSPWWREVVWCRCQVATHRAAQSSCWIHIFHIYFRTYM